MKLSRKNSLALYFGLIAVLVVGIVVGTLFYFQNQTIKPQAGSYTITGTLSYAPGHAIYPGISATTITPPVSPQPSTRTFTEGTGQKEAVASFVFLTFPVDLFPPASFPSNFTVGFPTGYDQNQPVKVTGEMSYETAYQAYVLNVTGIVHVAA
ncbi:MAG: hypothetical protein ACLQO7_04385 [Candidatus Bathyarchaeia archaeon]